ncbi:tetratricopeptide repeat protein [Opitutus sp. ER46]|uniref:tetratricopeptide repeat protein n=1 Tax=Opitutus sp. ER46 TaxID=2161864 RepID=UPI000D306AA5|nr:tetratricopeptide repeat protein [Opitutus sp. ER46]PTX97847.1 hypothetical protein DB354_06095 [Opitutus sp. ER46]
MSSRPPAFRLLALPSRPWVAGALLVVATLLAYANTLHAPFVFDDLLAIPQNPTIRRLDDLGQVLAPQANGGLTVSGRPVLNLSFALNYAVSGTAPWSYHLANVLIHTGAGLLLFGLVRRTLLRPRPGDVIAPFPRRDAATVAFLTAALWTLHPLQTQAITYTVQRAESLMGFFYLLTLYAFARGTIADSGVSSPRAARGWLGVSVAACVLGMATKEVMATAPLVVLLFDRTFVVGSWRAALARRRGYYAALAATWLLLAWLVLSTGANRGGTAGFGTGVPWWAYGLTQFQAVTRYLALGLWPYPLVFEYGTFWVARTTELLPYALLVLALVGAIAVAWRKVPAVGFCGACFFAVLAPSSLTPGTLQMIVEHRTYLPLAALLAVLVAAVARLGGKAGQLALAGAVVAAALLTHVRNHDYRSDLALWQDTVAKRPGNARAHDWLAEAYANTGQPEQEMQHRAEAVRLNPQESWYHYNYGLALARRGRHAEAILQYEYSLRLKPTEANTHNNLAIALGATGRGEAALAHYAAAVRLKPDDAQFRYNFGIALLRSGRLPEARAELERSRQLQPDNADVHFNLGAVRLRLGQPQAALADYAAALRLRPDDVDTRVMQATALLLAGQPERAAAAFQALVERNPRLVSARFGLGEAFATLDRQTEAIACFEAVLQQEPTHAGAHFKLGNALLEAGRLPAAIEHYIACLRLTPDDAAAHHNLGAAYAQLERWRDAEREFEAALRLSPDYPEAKRHLDQVRQILGR